MYCSLSYLSEVKFRGQTQTSHRSLSQSSWSHVSRAESGGESASVQAEPALFASNAFCFYLSFSCVKQGFYQCMQCIVKGEGLVSYTAANHQSPSLNVGHLKS